MDELSKRITTAAGGPEGVNRMDAVNASPHDHQFKDENYFIKVSRQSLATFRSKAFLMDPPKKIIIIGHPVEYE
jgi:hypothetical protein